MRCFSALTSRWLLLLLLLLVCAVVWQYAACQAIVTS
jgi:hypothetical protein